MNDLRNHCEQIAKSLSDPESLERWAEEQEREDFSALDYLEDVLDIEFIIGGRDRQYLGARVLVAFGGPNIWINTRSMIIEGAWWVESCTVPFTDAIGLDDALEVLYSCG